MVNDKTLELLDLEFKKGEQISAELRDSYKKCIGYMNRIVELELLIVELSKELCDDRIRAIKSEIIKIKGQDTY